MKMNDAILNQYVFLPNVKLSLLIDCKLMEFYTYKKAAEIAEQVLIQNGYPGVINIYFGDKENEIQKLLCLAKLRSISVNVTMDNVSVTIDDVVRVIKDVYRKTLALITDVNYDPYSEMGISKCSKESVIAELNKDVSRIIDNLKTNDIVLQRNMKIS